MKIDKHILSKILLILVLSLCCEKSFSQSKINPVKVDKLEFKSIALKEIVVNRLDKFKKRYNIEPKLVIIDMILLDKGNDRNNENNRPKFGTRS